MQYTHATACYRAIKWTLINMTAQMTLKNTVPIMSFCSLNKWYQRLVYYTGHQPVALSEDGGTFKGWSLMGRTSVIDVPLKELLGSQILLSLFVPWLPWAKHLSWLRAPARVCQLTETQRQPQTFKTVSQHYPFLLINWLSQFLFGWDKKREKQEIGMKGWVHLCKML